MMMSKNAWSPGRMIRSVKLWRVRAAALAGDRVDRFHAVRAHLVEALSREPDDLVLAGAGLERLEDVLVDAVDHRHRRRHVEQRQLVLTLEHPRLEHHLLSVAHKPGARENEIVGL